MRKSENPNKKNFNLRNNLGYIYRKEKKSSFKTLLSNNTDYIESNNLKIIENSVCKVVLGNKIKGTGFLSLIPSSDKINQLPVLITCNHIINGDEKEVKLIFNDKLQKFLIIDNTRKIYINKEKDIIIIEIKKEDNLNFNKILEIDYDIFEEKDLITIFKSIYIIDFYFGKESSNTKNIIENIKDEIIELKYEEKKGSSGEPILNSNNFKVIGIHKGADRELSLNIGILLKESIKNFNNIKHINSKEIYYYNNDDKYKTYYKNDNEKRKGNEYYKWR